MTAPPLAVEPTSCSLCRTPLLPSGMPEISRLDEVRSDRNEVSQLLEERVRVESRLAQVSRELEIAVEIRDEIGRVKAANAKADVEGRIASIDDALNGRGGAAIPDGECEGCGTVFVAGAVDMATMQARHEERLRAEDIVGAYKGELYAVSTALATHRAHAKQAAAAGDKVRSLSHSERVDALQERLPLVERELQHAADALAALMTGPPAARAERRSIRRTRRGTKLTHGTHPPVQVSRQETSQVSEEPAGTSHRHPTTRVNRQPNINLGNSSNDIALNNHHDLADIAEAQAADRD